MRAYNPPRHSREMAEYIQEKGFLIITSVLDSKTQRGAAKMSEQLMGVLLDENPKGLGRGPCRYSLGDTSLAGATLQLVDQEPVLRVLREYWRGVEFFVTMVGGDFSLPGAEQQGMHVDARGVDDLKVYFTTVDFVRVLQRRRREPKKLSDDYDDDYYNEYYVDLPVRYGR